MAEVDSVVLDKTGTLTGGSIRVARADDAVLRLAAGLERYSVHPIARAVLEAAIERGIPLPAADHLVESAGVGVSGQIDGRWFSLGAAGAERLVLTEWEADPALHTPIEEPYRSRVEGGGGGPPTPSAAKLHAPRTNAGTLHDPPPGAGTLRTPTPSTGTIIGRIVLEDRARTDSSAAIDALRSLELPVAILSGDDPDRADAVGQALGVDESHGQMTPAGKAAWLESRITRGERPLFAGDGINDGPALGVAHASIAMGSGAASSILIADGVIATDSIRPIAATIRIARHTRHVVRRAQLRSVAYNVIAVGAAAAGLVNPLVAAILMPLSSSLVLVSAAGIERQARVWSASDDGIRGD